jgi:hypothetical protein
VFKKGEMSGAPVLNIASQQVIVKRTWSDGSAKHAIASGHVALTANVPTTITVQAGTAPVGGLACSDITTANPQASVALGGYGTINLSSLFASPVRTWLTGPEAVECHYRGPVTSDGLVVWFYVRLYKNGRVWIRTVVDNGYIDVAGTNKAYVPSVTIGGSVVYNNGGVTLTQYAHTTWTQEGWIGGDPQITPTHNVQYLVDAKFVPNYLGFGVPAAASALNALHQTTVPMSNGDINPNMPDTGFQPQIGLLPNWESLYITSQADARAYRSVLANTWMYGSFGITWKNSTTGGALRPSDYPTWNAFGNNQGGGAIPGVGSLQYDPAHAGSEGYLAYLLTGDYMALEIMELQAAGCWLVESSGNGAGTARVILGQTRLVAWCLRSIGQMVGIGPLDSVVTDYQNLLATQATYWNNQRLRPGMNPLGYLYSYEIGSYGTGAVSPWQQHFWVQSYGHVSDLEPFTNMTTWNAVRDYTYASAVGILGPVGTSNYCFANASSYTIGISSGNNPDPTTWFTTWGQVYQATFGVANTSCGNTLLGSSGGDPASASGGYWGNLMPAIAYAVDHGAPGAAAAWARMTGATNWSTVLNSGFNTNAMWGIVPRGTVSTTSPAAPTGLRLQ